MENIIPKEDIEFLLSQNEAETSKIIAGMRAIIADNEEACKAMKNQKWYERIWKGITRQNKAETENMSENRDKLSAYCVQALTLLIQQKSVSDAMLTALAGTVHEMNILRGDLEKLVYDLGKKLDEKITSVDSYNNLITDIQNGKFNKDTPFISILDVLSRVDTRTAADPERLIRLQETLINKGFDLNASVSVQEITDQVLSISEGSVGRIYLLCQAAPELKVLNYCGSLIVNYFYQPGSNRPIIKDGAVKDARSSNGITDDVYFEIAVLYNDILSAVGDNLSNLLTVTEGDAPVPDGISANAAAAETDRLNNKEIEINKKIKEARKVIDKYARAAYNYHGFNIGNDPGLPIESSIHAAIIEISDVLKITIGRMYRGMFQTLISDFYNSWLANGLDEILKKVKIKEGYITYVYMGNAAEYFVRNETTRYLACAEEVLRVSEPAELANSELMTERIKAEIRKRG